MSCGVFGKNGTGNNGTDKNGTGYNGTNEKVGKSVTFSKLGFGVWELEIGNFIGLGIGV